MSVRRGAAIALVLLAAAANVHAEEAADPAQRGGAVLSTNDRARLQAGQTITRPQNYEEEGRRYVGGVTYTVVEASPEELLGLLEQDEAYLEVLPRTKHVERLGGDRDNLWVLLHHGNALVDAQYVLHVLREPARNRVRFWVDLHKPHDIEDAWGFFKWQELAPAQGRSRVLLTYGALVDVGIGMLRSLYEERVRDAMLSVPQRLRLYVDKLRAAGALARWRSAS